MWTAITRRVGAGRALLGDFGAAWSYAALPTQDHALVEAVEIRAFGILAQARLEAGWPVDT